MCKQFSTTHVRKSITGTRGFRCGCRMLTDPASVGGSELPSRIFFLQAVGAGEISLHLPCNESFNIAYRLEDGRRRPTGASMPSESRLGFRNEYEALKRENISLKEELNKAQEECEKMKRKYENLHKRVTTEIINDLGSRGDVFEDLSDPCNESRLQEMYEDLRLNNRQSLKRTMKSNEGFALSWKALHEKAKQDMEKQAFYLKNIFLADDQSTNTKKVWQNLASATHRLQEVFYLRSDKYYQNVVLGQMYSTTAEMVDLAAKYYKLMCLMLLHNPPMQPDWQKAEGPKLGIDERLFPPIKVLSPDSQMVEEEKQMSQASGLVAYGNAK
ncbi:uncharacterized protein LOC143125382 isoform X2 [Alosa pseudoharengus]|uniref:uncharacterized protein LOC143125382 isoform X2 n=1 Tax=Alosa pseudoharengus TaxID=34774 RepID=UPI003F889E90